jgi:hypothetical protein
MVVLLLLLLLLESDAVAGETGLVFFRHYFIFFSLCYLRFCRPFYSRLDKFFSLNPPLLNECMPNDRKTEKSIRKKK